MEVLSPVTGSICKKVESISTAIIIKKYQGLARKIDVTPYFKGISVIDIYECPDTGYRFYYPFTPGDDVFYEELQETPDYYSTWKWENKVAAKYISNNSTILDIGCGDGFFLEQMREKQGAFISGIEFNQLAIEKCKAKKIPVADQSIEKFSEGRKDTFDVVTAFQVLEHITAIKSFVSSALYVLKPGGKLIFGVPNNVPYIFNFDLFHTLNLPPHHAGLWSRTSLEGLAGVFKIKVLAIAEQSSNKKQTHAPKRRKYFHNYISYLRHTHQKMKLFWWNNFFGKIIINAWITLFPGQLKGHSIVAVFCKE